MTFRLLRFSVIFSLRASLAISIFLMPLDGPLFSIPRIFTSDINILYKELPKLINSSCIIFLLIMITEIEVEKLKPSPYKTRISLGDIESLAKNIQTHGLKQPILVRPRKDGLNEIVNGHRRTNAVKLLGWPKIQCFVEEMSDSKAAELTINENLQRKNLNPIEEALAYKILKNQGYTDQMIAERVNKSRPYITNSLGLIKMDPFIQAAIICGLLTISHARILSKLPPHIQQYQVADIAIDNRLSVRELEENVQQIIKGTHLFWRRERPIESILIQDSERDLTNNYAGDYPPIIDVSGVLVCGYKAVLEAYQRGEKTVTVDVMYWHPWLIHKQDSVDQLPEESGDNAVEFKTHFAQVLAKLAANPSTILHRYPIHTVKREGLFFKLVPK
ncbi:ParB/RepB/Spo0J family partition protein [Candidatus Bathyarchaeota archaeon]|nr:MAG: ParB/RepB/Spo0J family partition protein [Candidatus Bathyarchaeota archaeon]